MARHLGVVGSPISHSLSPRIHLAAYQALGLDWSYEANEVTTGNLGSFIGGLEEDWLGLSVTMPLKTEALQVAATYGEDAAVTALANTLVSSGSGLWHAENTDVAGLTAALIANIADQPKTVTVLGSGATAKSAVLAISRAFQASDLSVVGRNSSALEGVAAWAESVGIQLRHQTLAETAWSASDLVVSTIPSSAHAEIGTSLDAALMANNTLFDVAYDPWPSELAGKWVAAGGSAISGVEMLLQQALLQIDAFLAAAGEPPIGDRQAMLSTMRAAL